GQPFEQLRRGLLRPFGVHTHVERRLVPEAEAALWRVELERGDAEVCQDAARLPLARIAKDARDVSEIRVDGPEARAEARQALGGEPQGRAVAFNAEHARPVRGFEDGFAVPAKTKRRVHEQPPALRGEQLRGFNEQHGAMGRARPPSGLRHYHRPVVLKSSSELRATSDGVTSIGSAIPALALSLNTFTLCRFSDSEPRDRRFVFLRIRVGQETPLETLKLPNFQV